MARDSYSEMLYNDKLPVRYPKSTFAMVVVYFLTSASVLTSIFFSLLLFLSIDDDWVMMALFGSLAIIFELGKFFAWYEFGERRSRKNFGGALSALVFYGILAAISIGGSVGGINSATNKAQNHVNVQQAKVNAFNHQIETIEQQIQLNNEAAKKYIEMSRIAVGLKRIQSENEQLRLKQQKLAQERDSLPVVSQGSVLGLIDSLARALNIDTQSAKLGLVIFLSVLLDFFAAFFIGLIGEEYRFRQGFRQVKPITIDNDDEQDTPKLLTHQVVIDDNVEDAVEVEDVIEPPSLYQQAIDALESNKVSCTKKALTSFLKIDSEETDALFKRFMDEGLVTQKANKHYCWHGLKVD